ncbi:MAG: beta-galactosidase [Myxococcales bacterium]|nr:beta-galactosidase [Myxococcales bacterium]MCB9580349.1 beta-galactosidase [Polyangiaceae bacterium]
MAEARGKQVSLVPEGIRVGDATLPLYAGAVHYWRLAPEVWRRCLEAVRDLGFRLVDVYVPWGVHENADAELDFGRQDPKLDVQRFVSLCHELGLKVILRPGPHINAELTRFGIPERVIWDLECQARSPHGRPVLLPVPPLAFPVPSYASEAFHAEVTRWYDAVGRELASLCAPDGPIVLVQVDNEGSMYFRDGVYDQDWHPDALAQYRRFLQRRYGKVSALRKAHGDEDVTFARAEPPKQMSAHTVGELAPHLDWADFQEQLLADAFERMRRGLEHAGFGALPAAHNLPLSEGATPLDPERVGDVVELVGLDYYHGASMPQRREIARRTSELAVRSRARNTPAFACELGSGFPPFFPPLRQDDNAFSALTALAYGLRGLNAYMAVERDRWIGAPIDPQGRPRATSKFWKDLLAALERTRFSELSRHTPVHVVIPRSQRRLARVCHAFGPLSAALFQVLGGGAPEACFEDDFGLDDPVVIEAERFVRQLERALEHERVPYAVVSGDLLATSLATASWVIVSCTGGLEQELLEQLEAARHAGKNVTIGPYLPTRDHRMQPRERAADLGSSTAAVPLHLSLDSVAIEAAVVAARRDLALPTVVATPADVFATLHRDESGVARVMFVINASEHDLDATVTAAGAKEAKDALTGEHFHASLGALRLAVPKRHVRMLELLGKA